MASALETVTGYQVNDDLSKYSNGSEEYRDELAAASMKRHYLGVRPSGNALTTDQNLSVSMGILGRIPDSLLLLILDYLDRDALLNLSNTCKGLFAYSTHDQLWRDLALNQEDHDFKWRGSWRSSLLKRNKSLPQIDCRYLFSDALYRPYQCTNTSLEPYVSKIPAQNQIARLEDMSVEIFADSWFDRPFILTELVRQWQVYREWDETQLLQKYGDIKFRAEAVDWSLRDYVGYMNDNQDESPLYLFDRSFVEKMGLEVSAEGAYQPPPCFAEDLFTLLEEHRPDHRWLIIGPERSGSTFHKDPNATSAWNAVIRGSKYWIMFPNSITPPGVYMSDDQSEVTSPLSITEWLLTYHEEARRTPGCMEGICGPAEVLHVPSGWWHLVVNLEPAIAITQNFVPKSHLGSAINFLKNKPEQVSGFRSTVQDPHALFMQRLLDAYPELYEEMKNRFERKRKWEDVVAAEDVTTGNRGGFSFGFGNDDLEEE